jgi:hypothetical protein
MVMRKIREVGNARDKLIHTAFKAQAGANSSVFPDAPELHPLFTQ